MTWEDDFFRYESGEMTAGEIYHFFQRLIDSGTVWLFPARYARMTILLIDAGYCSPPIDGFFNLLFSAHQGVSEIWLQNSVFYGPTLRDRM